MAHFAQLNQDNVVIEVIVVDNAVIDDLPFPDSEPPGVVFCQSLFGAETRWVQTSYNSSFRYNYAGVGFVFDPTASPFGAFIPLQPYPSWALNPATFVWEAPVPMPTRPWPTDVVTYTWDELAVAWGPLYRTA